MRAIATLMRDIGDTAGPGAIIAHAHENRSVLCDTLTAVGEAADMRVVEDG